MDNERVLSCQDLAELAVVKNDVNYIWEGLKTLDRNTSSTDFRDIIMDISLFYHSTNLLGINADEYFTKYAQQTSNKEFQKHLTSFIKREPNLKNIKEMGYTVKQSPFFHYERL